MDKVSASVKMSAVCTVECWSSSQRLWAIFFSYPIISAPFFSAGSPKKENWTPAAPMHIALSPLMWVSIWSSRGLYAYWNDPRQFDTHLPVFSFSHCGTLIQFRFLRLEITLDNLKHACQLFQNCCCIYSQNYLEHKKSVWTLGAYCILANFSWAGKLRPPQYDADQQVQRNFLATTFLGSASKISSCSEYLRIEI